MGYATISLIVSGSELDPLAVTSALGAEPSMSRPPGDPALRRMLGDRAWSTGQWSLIHNDVAIDDVADVIRDLAATLQRGSSELGSAGVEERLISIGLFELRGLGEAFYLDTQTLRKLTDAGLSLWVDAYGSSPEDAIEEHE